VQYAPDEVEEEGEEGQFNTRGESGASGVVQNEQAADAS